MDRASAARLLGVSLRTVAEWSRQGQDADGDTPEPSLTREGIIFVEIMQLFQATDKPYLSLGTIADHVKATVDRRLMTREIGNRLENYVQLQLLEHARDDPEAYRPVVRPPRRLERHGAELKDFLGYLLPSVFDLGYQVYAGDEDSHARIEVFRIPPARRRVFVQAIQAGIRELSQQLHALEGDLQTQSPEEDADNFKVVWMLGPDKIDTTLLTRNVDSSLPNSGETQ